MKPIKILKSMKPYCLNPEIKDRDLRLADGIARLMMIILMLLILLLVCCSCGSTKVATQMVRDVRVDTVYLSNIQYDSIYIYKDHASEHHLGTLPPVDSNGKYLNQPMRTDTLYIKDVSIEYRYKLLKDTIRVVERDSIPYQVTVTEIKEIKRPLTWYDHFSRAVLWLNIGFAFYWLIRLIRKFL